MAGTDDEDDKVLDDVFASGRDRGADTAAPEPEPKAEATEEAPAPADAKSDAEAEQPDSQRQYRDPETGRFVPLHELKTERTKRQEEARLREEAETRARTLEQQLQQLFSRAVQPQQQAQHQPQQVQAPDPYTDPEGYQQYVYAQAQRVAQNERLHMSETLAIEKHGQKVVDDAFEAAQLRGVIGHFTAQRHPYGALVEWHKRQSRLDAIGDDFDGYESRIRAEERQKVLNEMKSGGSKSAPTRFPGTLADSTPSGGQGPILTDDAMMADVFGSDRRSRRRA